MADDGAPPRAFPGPAGALLLTPSASDATHSTPRARPALAPFRPSIAWLALAEEDDDAPNGVPQPAGRRVTIADVLQGLYDKPTRCKTACLRAQLRSVLSAEGEVHALLEDPTGALEATVHRAVPERWPGTLAAGAVLVLKPVCVVNLSRHKHHLAVTADTLVDIVPADGDALRERRRLRPRTHAHAAQRSQPESEPGGSPLERGGSPGWRSPAQPPWRARGTPSEARAQPGARGAGPLRPAPSAPSAPSAPPTAPPKRSTPDSASRADEAEAEAEPWRPRQAARAEHAGAAGWRREPAAGPACWGARAAPPPGCGLCDSVCALSCPDAEPWAVEPTHAQRAQHAPPQHPPVTPTARHAAAGLRPGGAAARAAAAAPPDGSGWRAAATQPAPPPTAAAGMSGTTPPGARPPLPRSPRSLQRHLALHGVGGVRAAPGPPPAAGAAPPAGRWCAPAAQGRPPQLGGAQQRGRAPPEAPAVRTQPRGARDAPLPWSPAAGCDLSQAARGGSSVCSAPPPSLAPTAGAAHGLLGGGAPPDDGGAASAFGGGAFDEGSADVDAIFSAGW